MDEDRSAAVDGSHVGDCFYRRDLRSPASPSSHVEGGHPLMLRTIAAAKKKNERIDAHKIANGLRCDFLPQSSVPRQRSP
jgi:hypothetical protein